MTEWIGWKSWDVGKNDFNTCTKNPCRFVTHAVSLGTTCWSSLWDDSLLSYVNETKVSSEINVTPLH